MGKPLDFSPDLKLPDDAVTQTFAFLARKGAGKTYGAGKLVELMIANGDQVVPIDPVGVWHGLRLAADGKKPGIPIPVFGGLHGDIPLEPTGGALVAKLIVEKNASVVLDVSQFRKNDRKRFVTDFAEELFHRKKSQRSPMHLVVEEAQVFVPQRVMGDEARMLGAFEDLIKLGRNFGVGVTLISQRPQSVNKDALTQTECLVVLQTNGAQERKALQDWIVEQGLDVAGLVDTLPSLERGEAWVWSPSWLRVTKRIHIGKKWTFDASATPERGVKAASPEPLDPVALDELAQSMAATIERAKAEDPKALRAEVARLRQELDRRKVATPAPAPATKEKRVEVPVLKEGQLKRTEALMDRGEKLIDLIRIGLISLAETIAPAMGVPRLAPPAANPRPIPASRVAAYTPPTGPASPKTATFRAEPPRADPDTSDLTKGERVMLTAIAQHGLHGVTREQLTVLTGYKRSSRDTYLQRLSARGILGIDGDRIAALDTSLLGPNFQPLPTGSALLQHWLQKLPQGERVVLEFIVNEYPASVPRERISEATGYKRSSRDTYLQRLSARRLVEDVGRSEVRASDQLFDGATAA